MSKILTSLLAGIAIGILVAPDKGTATRQRLSDMLSDFAEDVQDQAGQAARRIKNTGENIKDTLESKGREMKNDLKNERF